MTKHTDCDAVLFEDDKFCTQCGNEISSSDKFCGSCGNKITIPHKDIKYQNVQKDLEYKSSTNIHNNSIEYFSVSPKKLVILSTVTFGIYQFYWFYKNWEAVKKNGNEKISPLWRTFFTPIYCYNLFKRIFASSQEFGQKYKNIIQLTIVYLILMFFPIYSNRVELMSILFLSKFYSVIALVTIQKAINFNNSKIDKDYVENDQFVTGEKTVFIIGGIFFIIYVLYILYVLNLPINYYI